MATITQDLGSVSAYALAVEGGYTGTEAQYKTLMANIGNTAQEIEDTIDNFVDVTVPAQVALVTAEGTEQIGLVEAEGTEQIGLVDAAGDAVIASIPADYTTLTNTVTDLSSQISQTETIASHTYATTIPNNTDYDTLLTVGNYVCKNSTNAQTMTNCPVSIGHVLVVQSTIGSNRLIQNLQGSSSNANIYRRYYNGSTWSAWKCVAYTDDIPSVDATPTEDSTNPVASGGVYSAISSLSDQISQKVSVFTDTASGDIASFPDGADDMPIQSLVANIEPVQDLSGYDNPWPAGGGKNKFNVDAIAQSGDITVSNGVISVTGQSANSGKTLGQLANLTVGETYLLTATTTGSANFIYLLSSGNSWYFGTQRTITETDLNSNVRFYSGEVGTTAQISDVMIRLSSVSDGTFTPYSNVCPITGHTECKVTRTGKNMLDLDRTSGDPVPTDISNTTSPRVFDTSKYYEGARSDNYYYKNYITASIASGIVSVTLNSGNNAYGVGIPVSVTGGETYTFSAVSTDGMASFGYYDASWNYIGTSDAVDIDVYGKTTITVPSNAKYILVVLRANAVGSTGTFRNCQLEVGSTATAYEAYQGNTYTIDLDGTRYGGTLDVISGVLTVDKAMMVFDGTQTVGLANWNTNSSSAGWLYALNTTPNIAWGTDNNTVPDLISDTLRTVKYGGSEGVYGETTPCISVVAGGANWGIAMRVNDTSLTNNTAINAWLADNPVTVVYKLATPLTVQLTPQQIDTLKGTNNIWADTGSISSVEYPCDTKLYIQKAIAAALGS